MKPLRVDTDTAVSMLVLLACAFGPVLLVAGFATALSYAMGPVAGLSLAFSIPAGLLLLVGARRAWVR